jgi:hypothetical protein
VASVDSEDTNPASVFSTAIVRVGGSISNGTLIVHQGRYYVCTAGHGVVSQHPPHALLSHDVELVLHPLPHVGKSQVLRWTKLRHTMHIYHQLAVVIAQEHLHLPHQQYDMAVFELSDVDPSSAGDARQLLAVSDEKAGKMFSLFGVGLLRSPYDNPDGSMAFRASAVSQRISGVDFRFHTADLPGYDPSQGLSGLGLQNRKRQVCGFLTGQILHAVSKETPAAFLILSQMFLHVIEGSPIPLPPFPSLDGLPRVAAQISAPESGKAAGHQVSGEKRKVEDAADEETGSRLSAASAQTISQAAKKTKTNEGK